MQIAGAFAVKQDYDFWNQLFDCPVKRRRLIGQYSVLLVRLQSILNEDNNKIKIRTVPPSCPTP